MTASYTENHNLSSVPSWQFVTGSVGDLRALRPVYGIEVDAPNPTIDVHPTGALYFIDPRGLERYIASPPVDGTARDVAYLPAGPLAWRGRGIALVGRDLATG